jgi:hypothetical protein
MPIHCSGNLDRPRGHISHSAAAGRQSGARAYCGQMRSGGLSLSSSAGHAEVSHKRPRPGQSGHELLIHLPQPSRWRLGHGHTPISTPLLSMRSKRRRCARTGYRTTTEKATFGQRTQHPSACGCSRRPAWTHAQPALSEPHHGTITPIVPRPGAPSDPSGRPPAA